MLTSSGLRVRKRIRLRDHEYGGGCAYYVTICTYKRRHLFGECVGGSVTLSHIGRFVQTAWLATQTIRSDVVLDEFIVMPDHMHVILHVLRGDGDATTDPLHRKLFRIIGGFKSGVTSSLRFKLRDPDFEVWQPRFNDRIIRSDEELERKREYIRANPTRWWLRELE